MKDVAIIGAGIAGMAVATRLQAQGLSSIVFEAHGQPGGCAGFYRRKGFAFDVGATTLVDFEPGGVGALWLSDSGIPPVAGEALPGYRAWLPDRVVTLHRNQHAWAAERTRAFGDTPSHRALWSLLDRLAEVFWRASRAGIRLPLRGPADVLLALRLVGLPQAPLGRYMRWTMGDALRRHGLHNDDALCGLLSMLIEDTVHSNLDQAPLINAALGITIRGAGLTRAAGGMWGFWREVVSHYRAGGGELRVGCRVERVDGGIGAYTIETRRRAFQAAQVVSAVPTSVTARLGPPPVAEALAPYLRRDAAAQGGAIVVFLGVPEDEVAGQDGFTHHQLMQDYAAPLGDGNNMFVSVSAPGDTLSAPAGHRAVMLSTHTNLEGWEELSSADYSARKHAIGERLVTLARRVYPNLGERPLVYEVGTPATYERYTRRPRGAVGGVRLTLANANQHAVPHATGTPGFWLAGDTTWPGLGTVACVLGSRIVADAVLAGARRLAEKSRVVIECEGANYAIAHSGRAHTAKT
ncbi:MAG TPA: NAD(P)/FAD-dependent oxidoreductase [Ktedonobacterales bacterium]|nr:NAD(P)/FAD-dependent oxidoreductase [Ktedonobacterales bacterium]